MISRIKTVIFIFVIIAAALGQPGGQRSSARVEALSPGPINGDVSNGSGSIPQLNAAGTAWGTLDTAQGAPPKGGIQVVYTPTDPADFIAFPIQTAGATVTLRPTTGGTTLTCTAVGSEPQLSSSNVGQCFFRANFDRIHIYYMGQLEKNGQIRYQISGLTPAAGAGVFQAFDSNTVIPGSAPTPTTSRKPARLVLVLDKSGSMAWSSHPADDPSCQFSATPPCDPARWTILNRAVTQLLTVARAYALPGDQFAVALFDNGVTQANTFDLNAIDSATVPAFLTALGTRSPGGGTSIGAGVVTFKTPLTAGDAANYNQVMLVFTDGDQNVAPYVVTNATQVLINPTTNSPVGAGVEEFAPGLVKICPFALRSDSPSGTLGTNYLQQIGTLRCGGLLNASMNINPSNSTLIQFFLQVLQGTIVGDKLELSAAQENSATIDAGQPDFTVGKASETFLTSTQDVSYTLLLTWAEDNSSIRQLTLTKDGIVFELISDFESGADRSAAIVESGDHSLAVTLRAPYCNSSGECVDPAGEWTLDFETFAEKGGGSFTYSLLVLADNSSLASSFQALQATPGVNQPITLEATLTEGDAPITGLPDGSVFATIAGPDSGLGNVLSKADIKPLAGPDADQISQAGLKVAAMLADPSLRPEILAALEAGTAQKITLTEGDPGVYSATFSGAGVEGAYDVNFFVDGSTPDNNEFRRTFETTYYTEVVPDPASTIVTVAGIPAANCSFAKCFSVTITPTDASGNLLGPGKPDLFSLPGWEGTLIDTQDNLDGSYTLNLGYPDNKTPDPTIDIFGTTLTPPISAGQSGESRNTVEKIQDWINDHPLPCLGAVILVVFILVVLLIQRRRKP